MNNITIVMQFLKELEQHNNKEWFHSHKKEYEQAKTCFCELLERILIEVGKTDPSVDELEARRLLGRINRDTRFGADKSPYHTSFRAHISPCASAPIPCAYFINVQPCDNTIVGGGLFAHMFKDATSMIRQAIVDHPQEFIYIVENEIFKKHFTLLGLKLKKVPNGYDADSAISEYLKHKSWFIECHIEDKDLVDDDVFVHKAVELCAAMKPFNDFLNVALTDFKMPARP